METRFHLVWRITIVRARVRLGAGRADDVGIVGEKRLEKTILLILGAKLRDQVTPFPILAEGFRHRAVGLGKLGHHDRLRHEIRADAAQILGHGKGAKAQFGTRLDDLPIPRLAPAFNLVVLE